jgi:hypothetical protein
MIAYWTAPSLVWPRGVYQVSDDDNWQGALICGEWGEKLGFPQADLKISVSAEEQVGFVEIFLLPERMDYEGHAIIYGGVRNKDSFRNTLLRCAWTMGIDPNKPFWVKVEPNDPS